MRDLTRDQDGASSVEYALLITGIAAVIVLVVFALGIVISNQFSNTCSDVNTQVVAHGGTSGNC